MHSTSLGMTPREESSPGRTTDRVGIGLGEADPGFGELVDVRRHQVGGTVAIRIQGALVIGEEDHDVGTGFGGRNGKGKEPKNGEGQDERFHNWKKASLAGIPRSSCIPIP